MISTQMYGIQGKLLIFNIVFILEQQFHVYSSAVDRCYSFVKKALDTLQAVNTDLHNSEEIGR